MCTLKCYFVYVSATAKYASTYHIVFTLYRNTDVLNYSYAQNIVYPKRLNWKTNITNAYSELFAFRVVIVKTYLSNTVVKCVFVQ